MISIGCSDSSSNTDITVFKPGIGSTFVFNEYYTDPAGNKIPGTDFTRTFTVDAANVSYDGQNNVVRFKNVTANSLDTLYLVYQSNGDLLDNENIAGFRTWRLFPFHSIAPVNIEPLTAHITDTTGSYTVKQEMTNTRSGEQSAVVQDESLPVEVVRTTITMKVQYPAKPELLTPLSGNIYWCSKIGFVTKGVFSSPQGGFTRELVKYTLK